MVRLPPKLNEWIQRKLGDYKEKPRKGTPKGQPYGVPKRKYHAALLHLAYNRTFGLREVAKHAGVSYSLVLKWRTEERFANLVREVTLEYSEKILDTLLYGEHNSESSRLFRSEEWPRYSVFLVLTIQQDFFRRTVSHLDKVISSMRRLEKDWRFLEEDWNPVTNMGELFGFIIQKVPKTWGDKKLIANLYENRAGFQSSILRAFGEMFRYALENNSKNEAQKIFDIVSKMADGANRELNALRKTVVGESVGRENC